MTIQSAPSPAEQTSLADRLRDVEAVTDAALSRLDEQALLKALLDRVKKVLRADTAAVLLLDRDSRQLVATAASGLDEEVRQGFASRSALASRAGSPPRGSRWS